MRSVIIANRVDSLAGTALDCARVDRSGPFRFRISLQSAENSCTGLSMSHMSFPLPFAKQSARFFLASSLAFLICRSDSASGLLDAVRLASLRFPFFRPPAARSQLASLDRHELPPSSGRDQAVHLDEEDKVRSSSQCLRTRTKPPRQQCSPSKRRRPVQPFPPASANLEQPRRAAQGDFAREALRQ
jgi:hypothetical protein